MKQEFINQSAYKWRHQYDTKRDEEEGLACTIKDFGESLTQQHFKDDADLNVLAERFGLDKGPLPNVPLDPRYYGDVSNVPDLRTVLDIARDAQNKFMELDADLRDRFDHDPAKLWRFVNDPLNRSASIELGLLQEVKTEPQPAPVTPPPTPQGE